jgi:hypothetical protein
MPSLDNDTLIKQYFEQVKDKYPDIDFARFEKICKSPFYYIKSIMEREDMPTILVKYLGKFRVFSGSIKTLLRENDTKLHFKHLTPERHQERKEFLEGKLRELLAYEAIEKGPDKEVIIIDDIKTNTNETD